MKSAGAEGAAPRRRPVAHRAGAAHGRRLAAPDHAPRWSSATAPTRCARSLADSQDLQFVVQEPQWHRPRAAADGARPARQARHRGAAVGRRAAADRGHPRGAGRDAHRHRRRGDGGHGQVARPVRLRPDRPRQRARSRGSSKSATPRRRSAPSPRSTAASTPSTVDRSSRRSTRIGTDNAQGEYYLPDLIAIYRQAEARRRHVDGRATRKKSAASTAARNLQRSAAMVRQQNNEELMAAGVTLIDPATTYVDSDVDVGRRHGRCIRACSSRVDDGSARRARSTPAARIVNSTIGDRVDDPQPLRSSPTRRSPPARQLGPFAHMRPGSNVGEDAHVGNFVELKKTTLGEGSQGQPSGLPRRCDDRREA